MRFIRKHGGGGHHLRTAHARAPQDAGQASSRWSSYAHKAQLCADLLDEQFFLCCYCELRSDLAGLGYHIEHVQPKSAFPQRTFDYDNLAASALASASDLSAFKAQGEEVFAGHAKQSQYDAALFVSCHQADCARFFAYLSDGRVVAAAQLSMPERERAQYTIRILHLNSPYLIKERRNWWNELDALFSQHQADAWSIEHLAMYDLVPQGTKLSQFFSMTRQFFGAVGEQVLRQHAPNLL